MSGIIGGCHVVLHILAIVVDMHPRALCDSLESDATGSTRIVPCAQGELRPQLLDRFGLSVSVATIPDTDTRAKMVMDRLAYEQVL